MRKRGVAVLLGTAVVLGMLLAGFAAPALASAAPATDDATALQGTLRDPQGDPVSGVRITVLRQQSPVGTATTAADGSWQVALPGPGDYTVKLDTASLPSKWQPRNAGGETLRDVAVTTGQQRTVIFPLAAAGSAQQGTPSGAGTPSNTPDRSQPSAPRSQPQAPSLLDRTLQQLIEGIKFGVIIAITTVGLSLVFGTTQLINFAHGELVTIGATVAFFLSTAAGGPGWGLIPAAAVAVLAVAALGAALHRGLWRPLERRHTGRIQLLIISIGLSLLLRHVILVMFGSRSRPYNQYVVQEALRLGAVSITPRDLVITLAALAVLVLVAVMLKTTRLGKAMRAVADNRALAEASGIDVDRVVMTVWVIGGGLAAFGGVCYGLTEVVSWDMGFKLLLLMFAGMILGGLGSAYGAIVGSLIIGLVAQLSTLFSPPELQNGWALLVMVLVLLIRPQGVFGRAERVG